MVVSKFGIAVYVCHALAISSTLFRLGYRGKRRQLHWDDFWAFVALLGSILVMLIFTLIPIRVAMNQPSLTLRAFANGGPMLVHSIAVWSSRLSIAVTVVRLLPSGPPRRISQAACFVFVMLWLIVFVQKIIACGVRTKFSELCRQPVATAHIEIITDTIGDLWLVIWPAIMLVQMKLLSGLHRLLLAAFACGLITLGFSLWHSVEIIKRRPQMIGVTGHLQIAIALLVCNALVLVTYIYRVVRAQSVMSASSNEDKTSPTHNVDTTSRTTRMSTTFNDPEAVAPQLHIETVSSGMSETPVMPGTYVPPSISTASSRTNRFASLLHFSQSGSSNFSTFYDSRPNTPPL